MKVGVIEIMPKGHFTLVDAVVRIFASDKDNQVFIFTNQNGFKELKHFEENQDMQVKIAVLENNDVDRFLLAVRNYKLDRIYITTLEKYFKEFYSFLKSSKANLFIHNIDEWFQANLKFRFYTFFRNFSFSTKIIYAFKVAFVYSGWKKKIAASIAVEKGKYVVLSSILESELEKFVDKTNIEIIPFSVFDKNLKDKSSGNQLLRICIPGLISKLRRDYHSVIKLIENNQELIRDKMLFEFLGGVASEEGGVELLEKFKSLESKGINIVYYQKSRVPLEEFDEQLSKSDLILGNMKVVLDKYSSYGRTKDSGIIFTMIRAAKPGVLVEGYPVIEEMKSSVLTYSNNDDLLNILLELAGNKSVLQRLKTEALNNSEKFSPEVLYKNLV
jgi:hypothetical protein